MSATPAPGASTPPPPDRGAVVITGASSGIGEACARYLDARGFRVYAGVRRDADGERLRAGASDRLRPLRIDVTDARSIEEAAATIDRDTGRAGLAGLVNNAGIAVPGALEFLELDRIRQQLEVNVIGQVAVTQAFLPAIRRARGRIVNMGSIAGRLSTPFIAPYAMSKHAMEAYSDALRIELRPWKIHVALIEPGAVRTQIWDKGLATANEVIEQMPEEGHRLYDSPIEAAKRATAAIGESGFDAEDVARAVAHALESRRPKTRYLVGLDAQVQAVLRRWVPDRWLDRLVMRRLGL